MLEPIRLQKPPFPPLQLKQGSWEGEDVFPSWAGFASQRRGRDPASADGRAGVVIAAPAAKGWIFWLNLCVLILVGLLLWKRPLWLSSWMVALPVLLVFILILRSRIKRPEPSEEQVAAYEFLKKNEKEVAETVLAEILKKFPELRQTYNADEEDDLRKWMPVLNDASGLRNLISMDTVHVLNVSKERKAHVGFQFDCSWDEEHGLGVMTHGMRVVEIGIAESSFDEVAAWRDGGQDIKG